MLDINNRYLGFTNDVYLCLSHTTRVSVHAGTQNSIKKNEKKVSTISFKRKEGNKKNSPPPAF